MFRLLLQTSFIKISLVNLNHNCFRYVRSVAQRGGSPKLVEGKVKTLTKYNDDSDHIQSYKEFIKRLKQTGLDDELEVEKEFLKDDYHGGLVEKCDKFFSAHEGEEKLMKSRVKKKIVGRKYFKLDMETNLLTNSAKEQIRFLHNSNPLEWNYKAISECFPISEEGAKKLLRCKFVHTCSERIKQHDEEVAERWKILKSGKPTDLISPLTQKLYKEGKLVDDYFSGNPNLPTAPPSRKIIEVKKRKKIGEFSAIVKTYVEYEKQKLLTSGKETSNENQVSLRDGNAVELSEINDKVNIKKIRQYKFESDEVEDQDPEVYPHRRKRVTDDGEISFSQFKEILKDETSFKLKPKMKDEYDEFILKQTSMADEHIASKKPNNSQDCFLKVPKYGKERIDVIYEENKNATDVYKYDEKLGYQYPVGKSIQRKIHLPPSQRIKGKLHKVGQCVYDDDGEFLYKVPA